jgi:hypothetical protein
LNRELLEATLECLARCETIEEFSAASEQMSSGATAAVGNIPRVVCEMRDADARDYCESIDDIYSTLLAIDQVPDPERVPAEEYARGVQGSISRIAQRLSAAVSIPDINRLRSALFVQIAYLQMRAMQYSTKGLRSGGLGVDTNDANDSMLCLHLDLDLRRILVTNDRDLLKVVRRAVETARFIGLEPKCNVIGLEELRNIERAVQQANGADAPPA